MSVTKPVQYTLWLVACVVIAFTLSHFFRPAPAPESLPLEVTSSAEPHR